MNAPDPNAAEWVVVCGDGVRRGSGPWTRAEARAVAQQANAIDRKNGPEADDYCSPHTVVPWSDDMDGPAPADRGEG